MKNKMLSLTTSSVSVSIICPACKSKVSFKEVVEKNGSIGCSNCSS